MKVNVAVAWFWIAIGCAPVFGFEGDSPATDSTAKQAKCQAAEAAEHASLRYDGKPFDHWRKILLTELQYERQIEAIEALGAFAANGYSKESATAIAEFMSQPSRQSPKEREQTRLVSATVTAMGRANEVDVDTALVKWPSDSDATNDFVRRVRARFAVYTVSYPVAELMAPTPKEPGKRPDFDAFVTMLKDRFPTGTWHAEGGKSDIQMFETNRTVVLSAPAAVHALMTQVLEETRRTQPITRSYDVAALVRSKKSTSQVAVDFGPVLDLLTATVRPTSWDTAGGAGSLWANREALMLMVHQRPAVHREVEQLLEQLRSLQEKSIPIAPNVP